MRRAQVFLGSAETMSQLDSGTVALTVTSPPYWNAIDYDRYLADPRAGWKTRVYAKGFGTYDEYLALMRRVFAEVYRVTDPGGFCAVVASTVLLNKRMIPLPADLTGALTGIGWRFHQDIVWHKPCSPSRRGAVLVRWPYPGRYYPNTVCESVLVFRKPGVRKALRACREPVPIDALYTREVANNVWHILPVPPGRLGHPCPFPEELVHRLVMLYSAPDDLVLDPFSGSGQTLKVAAALGRRSVGYEIEPGFAALAERRAAEPYVRGPQRVVWYETLSETDEGSQA